MPSSPVPLFPRVLVVMLVFPLPFPPNKRWWRAIGKLPPNHSERCYRGVFTWTIDVMVRRVVPSEPPVHRHTFMQESRREQGENVVPLQETMLFHDTHAVTHPQTTSTAVLWATNYFFSSPRRHALRIIASK